MVCIGDVILDKYVLGSVERLSPEAPIPILKVTGEYFVAGGAANVAANLASLNIRVNLVSVLGDDLAAESLENSLSEHKTLITNFCKSTSQTTSVKTRFVNGIHQILRTDNENVKFISDLEMIDCLSKINNVLNKGDVLLISDYGKGVLTDKLLANCIDLGKSKNCLVVVDPKGRVFSKYKGADILTPNLNELKIASGRNNLRTEMEIESCAKYMLGVAGVANILVTRGKDGVTLVRDNDQPTLHVPSFAEHVYDVSGAGDTVVALLSASLASGQLIDDAIVLANFAASLVVKKPGTAVLSINEIDKAINASKKDKNINKVCSSLDQLLNRLIEWRASGCQIGFANGCFDLFHQGHLHLLKEASNHCDRLIVAVNSDESVKLLKGFSRPIMNDGFRAELISHFDFTDAVIIFGDSSPENLINLISPNILFKGKDYLGKNIAGEKHVLSMGGKIHLIDLLPGYSTSSAIERLSNA